jgi:hypothetical protein
MNRIDRQATLYRGVGGAASSSETTNRTETYHRCMNPHMKSYMEYSAEKPLQIHRNV